MIPFHVNRFRLRRIAHGSRLAVVAGIAALAACDARELTAPGTPAKPRPFVSAPVGLGTSSLPAPPTSSPADVLTYPYLPLMSAPESTWVVVTVDGSLSAQHNPACDPLPPNWACGDGPAAPLFDPGPGTNGPVQTIATGEGGSSEVRLRRAGGGSAVGLYYQRSAGQLMGRLNLNAVYAYDPTLGATTASYLLGGRYTVSATAVPAPFGVTESAPDADGVVAYTVEPLYGLQFTSPVNGWPAGATFWAFYPGDSLPDKPDRSWPGWEITECQFKLVCTWKPPVAGRMQVLAHLEDQSAYARGKRTPTSQEPRLVFSCTPLTVTRGNDVSCNASVAPSVMKDSFTLTGWSFSGRPRTDGDLLSLTWAGPMVDSGMVRVQGRLRGRSVADSATIAVSARVWPEIQITSVSHRIKRDVRSMAHYPPDGLAFGRHQRGGLDSVNMQVRRIDHGPNTGYWYLGDPMRILPSTVYVHPSLYLPSSLPPGINSSSPGYSDWRDFYDDQNGTGSGTCQAAAVITFRQNVERHEGVTLAADSHVGIANFSFRRDSAQKKMERIVNPADSAAVRQRVRVLWDSLTNATSGYRQLQAHFDSTDTPNVYHNLGCILDMNRSDP